jgi:allophanate hydrolase
MTRALLVEAAGPGVSLQDTGRSGYLSLGVGRGGAADRRALAEGAALLGQSGAQAALELAAFGGAFLAEDDIRIALTGAPMRAAIDARTIAWNASHLLPKGARLTIGAATAGTYGYLHVGGGFGGPELLGSRASHLLAGLGAVVSAGQRLTILADPHPANINRCLDVAPRFEGGPVRIVRSLQTRRFSEATLERFTATAFTRDMRGNRMGVRLNSDGEGFKGDTALNIVSEIIVPGDIQITGDGAPFVLLAECQTIGGYPRIGTVIPCDLPRVAQASPGASLSFGFVSLEDALAAERADRAAEDALRAATRPLIRDPADMADLLSYQLVGGVTAGDDLERNSP